MKSRMYIKLLIKIGFLKLHDGNSDRVYGNKGGDMKMKPSKTIFYWVGEFTTGRSEVLYDWIRAKSATNAAKAWEREYGGIVYWIEGPFKSKLDAEVFMKSENLVNNWDAV